MCAQRKRAERAGCDKAERWADGLRAWLGLGSFGRVCGFFGVGECGESSHGFASVARASGLGRCVRD